MMPNQACEIADRSKTAQPPVVTMAMLAELSEGLGDGVVSSVVSWKMGPVEVLGAPEVLDLVVVGVETALEGSLKMSRIHFCMSLLSV